MFAHLTIIELLTSYFPEAVVSGRSSKYVFLKISQNLKENTGIVNSF